MSGLLAGAGSELRAEQGSLAFQVQSPGLFGFDTGLLRGRLKMDGHYQGLYPVFDKSSGVELTMPPGLLSPYRVFSRGVRYGDAARDWPTSAKLRTDGGVEVFWPAQPEHPLKMTALYRWSGPNILDCCIEVTPEKDFADFELYLSSYLTKGFRAAVYLNPVPPAGKGPAPVGSAKTSGGTLNEEGLARSAEARFVSADRPTEAKSMYVMFPRDEKALRIVQDGRWKIPPSPVDWDVQRWLAKPICLRRDATLGCTVVLMSPVEDCFAMSSTWNQANPQAGGYRSLYLSLFGRDIKAGQTASARCRLIIGKDLSDRQILELYEIYTKEIK